MKIETVFEGASHPAQIMYESSVRCALKQVFPNPLFFDEVNEAWLQEHLPLVKWLKWEGKVSIFLFCENRPNIGKFFYEMVSRWLIPGRRLDVAFYFTTDFRLPDVTHKQLTIAEMVIHVEKDWEWEQNLKIIETEVRLGMVSIYHASRILEIPGTEKSTIIQERITAFLQRWPDQIDYDIFGEAQHFLVMSKDEFRVWREASHLSRLVAIFYLFRKFLQREVEALPDKRHLKIKLASCKIHLPWGVKKVLSIFVGMNFLKQNELFEERHFVKTLRETMPGVKPVEDSFFVHEGDDDQIHLLYLEVEKEDGTDFSLEEIKNLRIKLPDDLKKGIEVMMRPLFMPRNEEEILRDIVTLAGQLKFVKDIPQVILIFDQQTESDLCFTVIFLRILMPGLPPVADAFKESFLNFIPDRIKRVGMIRKKYPKEATVFRIRFSSSPFWRSDHFVDLFKARQAIVVELHRLLGEVRDYNGGMISKQMELFEAFKEDLSSHDEHLLENFFHSIYPSEMGSVLPPETLKILFLLFQEKEEGVKVEGNIVYFVGRKEISFGPHQFPEMKLALFKLDGFFGCLYFSDGQVDQDHFLTLIGASCKTLRCAKTSF